MLFYLSPLGGSNLLHTVVGLTSGGLTNGAFLLSVTKNEVIKSEYNMALQWVNDGLNVK